MLITNSASVTGKNVSRNYFKVSLPFKTLICPLFKAHIIISNRRNTDEIDANSKIDTNCP